MPLTKLQVAPGIDKQNTEYGAEGKWVDSEMYAFVMVNLKKLVVGKKFQATRSWVQLALSLHGPVMPVLTTQCTELIRNSMHILKEVMVM